MNTEAYIEISIHHIRRDGGTQPRAELDENHIEDLVLALGDGASFDPILLYFDGSNYWLTDGFHRLAATTRRGLDKIKAEIRQGTQQDAIWHSFAVNQHHALKRSNADKQRAIIGALKHPYGHLKSNKEIARHCGVADITITDWRRKLEQSGEIEKSEVKEVTRGGQSYSYRGSGGASTTEQKFKVISPDIPEYYGQEVELVEIKSGDLYQCKLPDGSYYPFAKSELGDVKAPISEVTYERTEAPVTPITSDGNNRQRLISIVLRLPESQLKKAEELLIKEFGEFLTTEPIGI
ncbi:MAG: ParB/RepB/Spo0J family partition protein [Calothrix sp. FI2-JRJ7]|jgi:hypothetical protein|nr:ParB/RepB/Spo0J family partition protein [Calothrix sp. FI2-JRJ7]